MVNKSISLPSDIYDKLRKEKRKGETFAELIIRLLKRKKINEKKLEDLAGAFKDDDEWDDIIVNIYADRNNPGRIIEE